MSRLLSGPGLQREWYGERNFGGGREGIDLNLGAEPEARGCSSSLEGVTNVCSLRTDALT